MIEFISIFLLIAFSFTAIAIGVIIKKTPISVCWGLMANCHSGAPSKICGPTTIGGCEE